MYIQTTVLRQQKNMIIMSTAIRHFFVYGSLRPDDDSKQSWTKSAVSNLYAQKARLLNAKLYEEEYACAVLLDSLSSEEISSGDSGSNNDSVIGYVLSTNDEGLFNEKLQLFDDIEGYNYDGFPNNLYDRTVRDVELIPPTTANVNNDNNNSIKTRESVKAYVYHRTNQCKREKLIPSGDWLQRER